MKKSGKAVIIVSLLIFFCSTMIAQVTPQEELTKISFQKSDKQATCVIECSKPISYETYFLLNPNRLVLDLSNIGKINAPSQVEVNDFSILKITIGTQAIDTARIVVYFMDDILKYKIKETESGLNLIFWKNEEKKAGVQTEEKPAPAKKTQVQAEQEKPAAVKYQDSSRVKDISVGFNMGYYFLQDSLFQEIYGKSVQCYRGEISFTLPFNVNNFDIWTAVTHFKKTGKTTLYEEAIDFSFTSFSMALRYLKKISMFTPFIGAGVDYISYKEIFPDNFQFPSMGGSDLGFHIQGGVYIHISPYISGKLHVRYLTSKTMENNFEVNLGGIEYAFGLIFHFDL